MFGNSNTGIQSLPKLSLPRLIGTVRGLLESLGPTRPTGLSRLPLVRLYSTVEVFPWARQSASPPPHSQSVAWVLGVRRTMGKESNTVTC